MNLTTSQRFPGWNCRHPGLRGDAAQRLFRSLAHPSKWLDIRDYGPAVEVGYGGRVFVIAVPGVICRRRGRVVCEPRVNRDKVIGGLHLKKIKKHLFWFVYFSHDSSGAIFEDDLAQESGIVCPDDEVCATVTQLMDDIAEAQRL